MKIMINKNKLKYRVLAVVITLLVLLSYVVVFFNESYAAYSGSYSPVVIASVVIDYRNSSGKVVSGSGKVAKTSKFTDKYNILENFCVFNGGDSSRSNLCFVDKQNVDNDSDLWTYVYADENGWTLADGASNISCYSYTVTGCYEFKDKATCLRYLNGQMTGSELASSALNYNEVAFGSAEYDSSVPSPDKLYIDSLSSTSVSAVWSYSDSGLSFDNVTYKVEVENFYVTTSLFNSIAKGWTGKTGESSWKFNGTIDECNRLKGMSTVETYLSSPTKILADEVLVSANVISDSGSMHSTNTFVCTPTDYSGKFASSGNAFFTGATNSHWAEYCGSQVTVTPYMTVDGVTKKGSAVVCRRFTSDMLNTIIGSTYTKVGTDSSGKEYIESTNRQDNTGSSTGSYEQLDTDNVLEFIKNGFGILGNNGVIALAQTVFLGIPVYIWMLYGTLVAVTIVVIVFKILRGF